MSAAARSATRCRLSISAGPPVLKDPYQAHTGDWSRYCGRWFLTTNVCLELRNSANYGITRNYGATCIILEFRAMEDRIRVAQSRRPRARQTSAPDPLPALAATGAVPSEPARPGQGRSLGDKKPSRGRRRSPPGACNLPAARQSGLATRTNPRRRRLSRYPGFIVVAAPKRPSAARGPAVKQGLDAA